MPSRLIQKVTGLFRSKSAPTSAQEELHVPSEIPAEQDNSPQIIPEQVHQIPRKHLDDNAAKVVYRLIDAGYEGYFVGGCIRDILINKRPKDFDIATNAHPEEAHELFQRSRLIGRRFKLLHVRFGRELIEVATFRAGHDSIKNEDDVKGKQSESGLILRDNVYGTIEEDALRRDFTVNAMYYCVKDHSIYDFTHGYQDIQSKIIRMIGNPDSRYIEDPVRMLRAIRFAAKLDFTIEAQTAAPIKKQAHLLQGIAPARLFDETLKLLQSGHAVTAYHLLKEYHLLEQLLPSVGKALKAQSEHPLMETLILQGLKNTDRRLSQRKSVTPAFLFATMLWHPLQTRMKELLKQNPKMPQLVALNSAANDIIAQQVKRTAIPRRFSTPIREIWELQLRLPKRFGHRAELLLEHPRFRAAYDLLLLREQSGESLDNLGQWWTQYQSASAEEREAMVAELTSESKPARKPRRRRRASNDPRNA
ncbi:polynucleotide adenylyltransferase PcnB [Neptunomonas antarctica]|uniref:Poly(A) polymerase I n=1 Tax=Neptunomonas antarctica TaxID=619304 RepID=A0A1N7PLD6_9GAMM|nr:polynucleotide adenylyltransferase PcnB [Neptunomonas antarctica]SIT11444.1 poly(A) polymerase [Neptunomonas antarctica]